MRIVRETEASVIRARQILEQADKWNEVSLTNITKRGGISIGSNKFFPFRYLTDEGTISTATSLSRKDLKLRACIGDPSANQKNELNFVSVKHQIYQAQR